MFGLMPHISMDLSNFSEVNNLTKTTETILITGCSGQDGRLLIDHLSILDLNVIGTTRSLTKLNALTKLYRNRRNVKIVQLNLENFSDTELFISSYKPDTVFHLAAQSSVGLSYADALVTERSILDVTYNLITAMRHNRSAKFFNFCSSECFGECPSDGANENTNFMPVSPYANAKISAALLVETFIRQNNLNATNLFLFNHESQFRKATFVTAKIIDTALEIKNNKAKKLVLGNLDIYRDWCWADEMMAFLTKIRNSQLPERLVLGSGTTMLLRDFVDIIFNSLELDTCKFVITDQKYLRSTDIKYSLSNPSLATNEFNWKPTLIGPGVVMQLLEQRVRS